MKYLYLPLMILYAMALPCEAALVTWNLVDVKIAPGGWDNGTSASGWFTYDAKKMTVVDWDIVSPGHFVPCCHHFDIEFRAPHASCGASCEGSFVDVVPEAAPGGGSVALYFSRTEGEGNSLLLTTAQPLTDVGGTVTLLPSYSKFHCCGSSSLSWPFTSGVLMAVPEPPARLVLAFALFALLSLRQLSRAEYRGKNT